MTTTIKTTDSQKVLPSVLLLFFFKQKYMFCLPSFLSVDDLEAMRNVNIYRQIRAKNDNQLQSLTDFHVCAHQE